MCRDIKILSASMLPNLRLYVEFNTGENKYIKSDMLNFALDASKKGTSLQKSFAASAAPLTWFSDIKLQNDGKNILLNGHSFSAGELYEKGTVNL